MSSMAGPSHIRFIEPMALPPRDRPRRSDVKYPRVAQRKGEGDRTIPDCRWRFKALSATTYPTFRKNVEARNPLDDGYDAVKELLVRACEVVAKVPTSKRTSCTTTPKRLKLRLRYDPTKSLDTYTLPQLVFDSADSSATNSSANTPCSEDMQPVYPSIDYSAFGR